MKIARSKRINVRILNFKKISPTVSEKLYQITFHQQRLRVVGVHSCLVLLVSPSSPLLSQLHLPLVPFLPPVHPSVSSFLWCWGINTGLLHRATSWFLFYFYMLKEHLTNLLRLRCSSWFFCLSLPTCWNYWHMPTPLVYVFLILAVLQCAVGICVMVKICISLITNESESLFHINWLSLFFNFLVYFQVELPIFFLLIKNEFCMFWTLALCHLCVP